MAGLPKIHCLMVAVALALLVALGDASLGVVDSERPLGEVPRARDTTLLTYSSADDGAAVGPRNGEEFEACGNHGNHARMYSDGLNEAALGGDCESGRRSSPRVWMLPEPEVVDQLQAAEAPAPSSPASVVGAGLAWTWLGLLLSSLGPFMSRWWH